MRRFAGDRAALEGYFAAAWPMHAEDGADQRRLAGAVRADDGHHLARGHLKRHIIERLRIAVEQVEFATLSITPLPALRRGARDDLLVASDHLG